MEGGPVAFSSFPTRLYAFLDMETTTEVCVDDNDLLKNITTSEYEDCYTATKQMTCATNVNDGDKTLEDICCKSCEEAGKTKKQTKLKFMKLGL